MLEVATKDDLIAIHAQLGELKYKVEKLEAINKPNEQLSAVAEAFKKIPDCTKPCTCSCTKPEQPALEWEVWFKGRLPKFIPPDWEFEDNAFKTEQEAIEYVNATGSTLDTLTFEVRHNPKRKTFVDSFVK